MKNRHKKEKLANELFHQGRKIGGRLTVLFIDLDRLKYINDNLGHGRGDFAIRTISCIGKMTKKASGTEE